MPITIKRPTPQSEINKVEIVESDQIHYLQSTFEISLLHRVDDHIAVPALVVKTPHTHVVDQRKFRTKIFALVPGYSSDIMIDEQVCVTIGCKLIQPHCLKIVVDNPVV